MALSLAQLTNPGTSLQAEQQVLDGMAGRGVPTKTGTGTGSIALTGTPAVVASIIIQIVAGGEPGVATFYYSTDGGTTYSAAQTVPTSGSIALGSTGVSVTFSAGPAGAGTSFAAGDFWNADIFVSSLPVLAWQDGSVPKTLALVQGQALADQRALIAQIARGGAVTLSPGITGAAADWLDLAAANVYSLTRNAPVITLGNDTLTDTASAGPFTIAPGQLWIVTPAGLRFNNTNGGTLSKGGTLTLAWSAEAPGAAYNAAGGSAMALVTTLPGVTCSAFAVTQQGADAETDVALATRCQGRWAALGTGSPAAAYDLWARTASSEVTRTKVVADGVVAGQVDVYLAGSSGPVSGGAVSAVASYLTPRVPLCSTPNVVNAAALAVTVAGTVHVLNAYLAAAQAKAAANLLSLFQAIAIGGTVYLSAVVEQIMTPTGVRDCAVTLNGGSADIALTATQVATLTNSLSWVGV